MKSNIVGPSKIMAFKSTETRMLLGETALDEMVAKEKENKINAQP